MSVVTRLDSGRAAMLGKHARRDGTAPVVVYCHGHAGDAWSGFDSVNIGQYQACRTLANAGYLVVASDMGGSLWGNDVAHAAVDSLITWAQSDPWNGKTGKVMMMGTSMGATAALSYAGRYPGKVSCVVALEPLTDLVLADPGYVTVDSSYGGNYTNAAYGSTHNPIVQAGLSQYAGMPIRLWYGDSDTVVTPASVVAFRDAVTSHTNPNIVISTLSGGHAESTTVLLPPASLFDFADTWHPIAAHH